MSSLSTTLTGTSTFIPECAFSDSEEEDNPLDKQEELRISQKSEEFFRQLLSIDGKSYLDKIPKIDEEEIDKPDDLYTVRYIFAKMLKEKGPLFQGYTKEDKKRFIYFKTRDDQNEESYVCIFNIAACQNMWNITVSTFIKTLAKGKKDLELHQWSYTLIDQGQVIDRARYKNLKNLIRRAVYLKMCDSCMTVG